MPDKIKYKGEGYESLGGLARPHGHGKMKHLDGTYAGYLFKGEFADGYKKKGKWYRPDGNLEFEGEFEGNHFHGQGVRRYFSDEYDGEYAGYRFEGQFVGGCEEGRGKWYLPDGTLEYDGEWSNGYQHGQGTWYYPGSTTPKYSGEWSESYPTGLRTWYCFDGNPDDGSESEAPIEITSEKLKGVYKLFIDNRTNVE